MADAPPEQPLLANRPFLIGLGVLVAVAAAGLFFFMQLGSYSPAEIQRADLLQREGKEWKKIQAQLRGTHTRDDELAAYESFLKQFPPQTPPNKREAEALAALATLKSQEAPPTLPPE